MSIVISNRQGTARHLGLAACVALFASTAWAKIDLVGKWGQFEKEFKSSVNYQNPIEQCALKVTFVSPSHETNVVDGFWDGGKTWRVRFSPDQPGRWTYRTACSDPANRRLENQSGEFLCTSPIGQSRFAQHGPIYITRDGHRFQHEDGTPFFWMADVAWNAPRLSTTRDWITYTQTRGGQHFSAVQWAAAPGTDVKGRSAFSGDAHIAIDPEYFRALDEKIDLMNRAGLLSVIAPLWGSADAVEDLPEDQAELLIRYMKARWGAYDVAWLLTVNENHVGRWMRIGQNVFGPGRHAPVIIFQGELASGFDEFRAENWVDAFGFGLGQNMNNDSLKWLVSGPLGHEWLNARARPLINVLPPMENGAEAQGQERITANDVRRIAWWSVLLTPPAGVSYGAQDVATWNTTIQSKLPTWQLSLFLPGAKQMSHLAELFASADHAHIHPVPRMVMNQPGRISPRRYTALCEDESKDFAVAYVPVDRTVEVNLEALPSAPVIQWLNPRTGKESAAVAVVGTRSCQFPTPDSGDWVLVMKSGK
ncbi:MAG TPA: DUF4038 domain-containing protein [Candidatus Angelobacter sp.]|nr:DUF4038 domain-containing protein [Candidatus Angelobacter sp.]